MPRARSRARAPASTLASAAPPPSPARTSPRTRAPGAATSPFSPASHLATFSELSAHPDVAYLADSQYIHSGYRHRRGVCASLRSLCELHNETANVCTHLGGALVALFALGALLVGGARALSGLEAGADARAPPEWPLAVFLCGAATCLGLSATYHLFAPLGRAPSRVLQRLDYAGISALIFTSNVPPIMYVFACQPALAAAYIGLSFAVNGACVVMGMRDEFASTAWRKARAGAYVVAGALGAAPIVHAIAGARAGDERDTMLRFGVGLLSMGAQYVLGAALYALRIPERYAPGRFDYLASHALFHVLVLTAAATHWETIKDTFLWRAGQPSC